jgi:hypothetical protein
MGRRKPLAYARGSVALDGKAPLFAKPVLSKYPGLNDAGIETLLGRPEEGLTNPLTGWIGPDNLEFALGGGRGSWREEQYAAPLPPFVCKERQAGVAIDGETGTARQGMLYFLESLRFERGSGLIGSLQGPVHDRLREAALTDSAGTAGRRGRVVLFEEVTRVHAAWERVMRGDHLPAEPVPDATFWLVLLTPVRLDNVRDLVFSVSLPSGIQLTIVGALTGPPIIAGGYRMATGSSRENRPYVPAGSAWLFHLTGGTAESRREYLMRLHDRHTLGPPEEAAFGFGHTVVGCGPEQLKEGL